MKGSQRGRAFLRHAEHGVFHHVAVIGDIVAGEHCEGRQAALATAMESFNQDPRRGVRLGRMFQVVNNARVLHVQPAGRRVDAIALFGNGE